MEFLPIRIEGKRVYASVWKRFCAVIVELIILMPLVIFQFYIINISNFNIAFVVSTMIFLSLLLWIYNIYFDARFGGNLGKLAVKIRITKPDGSRIGWSEVFVCLFNKRKRALHDFIAGTVVVHKEFIKQPVAEYPPEGTLTN